MSDYCSISKDKDIIHSTAAIRERGNYTEPQPEREQTATGKDIYIRGQLLLAIETGL